jgi:PST family polysaccharide transporter
MSRLADDPGRYRSYYFKYSSLLAFVSMPLVAILYACADNIIRLFLGDQWLGAVELFRIMALAGFIYSVASLRITVIMSSGHGKRLLRWGLLNTLGAIAAYVCGLPWGAKGVAIASCLAAYLTLHPLLVYAFKDTPVRTSDFYNSIVKPGLASIGMCILYMLTIKRFLHASDLVVLVISVASCLIVYLALLYLLPGGKHSIIDFFSYISVLFRKQA